MKVSKKKLLVLVFVAVGLLTTSIILEGHAPKDGNLQNKLVNIGESLSNLKARLDLLIFKLGGLRDQLGAVSEPSLSVSTEPAIVMDMPREVAADYKQVVRNLSNLRKFLADRKEEEVAIISAKNLEAFLEARADAPFEDFALQMAKMDHVSKQYLKVQKLYEMAQSPNLDEAKRKKVDALVKKIASTWLQKTREGANPIREKLAKWWIRNAAVRIFHDNMRAFLEIVVNACDATLKKAGEPGGVGKFGMGFFSILSFLAFEETDGTILTIKTSFKPEGSSDPKDYDVYQIVFDRIFRTAKADRKFSDWNDADIQLLFKWFGEDQREAFFQSLGGVDYDVDDPPTGTLIAILPKNRDKVFSVETIKKLEAYIHYLDDYDKVKINLYKKYEKTGAVQYQVIGKSPYSRSIDVRLTPVAIFVQDNGTGISLYNALLSLMIPSVSTKGKDSLDQARRESLAKSANLPKFFEYKDTGETKKSSHFLITINDVIVIDKDLGIKLTDGNGLVRDLVVSMPQATQLTLARDEIEFSLDGNGFEDVFLKKMIGETIEGFFTGALKDSSIIEAFYQGLSEYEKQTASHQIYGRFTSTFRQKMEELLVANKFVYTIPSVCKSELSQIFEFFKDAKDKKSKVLPISKELANNNFTRFENFLHDAATEQLKKLPHGSVERIVKEKCINEKIISGMKVYIVPDDILKKDGKLQVTSFGLRSSIFMPQSFFYGVSRSSDEKIVISLLCCKIISHYSDYPIKLAQNIEICDVPFIISTITDDIVDCDENGRKLIDFSRQEFYEQKFKNHIKKIYKFSKVEELDSIWCMGTFFDYKIDYVVLSSIVYLADKPITNLFKYYDVNNRRFCETVETCSFLLDSIYVDPNFLLYVLLYRYGVSQRAALLPDEKIYIYNPKSHKKNRLSTLFPAADNTLKTFGNVFSWLWLYTLSDNRLITYDPGFEDLCLNGFFNPDECAKKYHFFPDYYGIKERIKDEHGEKRVDGFKTISAYKNKYLKGYRISNFLSSIQERCNNDSLGVCDDNGGAIFPIFIGLKGKTKAEVEFFIKELYENLSQTLPRVKLYLSNLENSISNINSFKPFLNLELLNLMITKAPFSVFEKNAFEKLMKNISSLYDSYFNIPYNEFERTYGSAMLDAGIVAADDTSVSAVSEFLKKIKGKKVFNKLLDFQSVDFAMKTDSEFRRSDLQVHRFYVPSILSNTPLSVSTALDGSGISSEVIETIIENSNSPEELMLTAYLFLDRQNVENLKKIKNIESIKFFITRFIREKIDKDKVQEVYNNNRILDSIDARVARVCKESFAPLVKDYLKEQASPEMVKAVSMPAKTAGYEFLLSVLMRAHCVGNGLGRELENNNLVAALSKIKLQEKNGIDTGKISQAIEAGSERSPIEASIIETLQNSVDVIKKFFEKYKTDENFNASFNHRKDNGKISENNRTEVKIKEQVSSIDYELALVKRDVGNANLMLAIQDYVGMPSLKTLLTDLVLPDYSNKSPEQGNVGDMGNGTFLLYKKAELVVVKTRVMNDSDKIFVLKVEPVHKPDSGLVYDLKLSCEEESGNSDFYGTRIEVYFQAEQENIARVNLVGAKDFILNACGAVTAKAIDGGTVVPVKVYLNRRWNLGAKAVNPERTDKDLIYRHVENGKTLFNVYRRSNELLQSYVTTVGVPFRPLAEISRLMNLLPLNFISMLSSGIILDMSLGTYEPVQSRTRLKISDKIDLALKKALFEAYYQNVLQLGATDPDIFEGFVSHIKSKVNDFHQLELNRQDKIKLDGEMQAFLSKTEPFKHIHKKVFFEFYKSLQAGKCLFDFLSKEYDEENTEGLVGKINERLSKTSSDLDVELKAWTMANESAIQMAFEEKSDEKKEALKKDFESICSKHSDVWEILRNKIFNEESLRMLKVVKDEPVSRLLVERVVIPWFEPKIKSIGLSCLLSDSRLYSNAQIESSEKRNAEFQEVFKGISSDVKAGLKTTVNTFLNTFVKIFFRMIGKNPNDISAEFYRGGPRVLGFYSNVGKRISINLAAISLADQLTLMMNLHKNDLANINDDAGYKKLFVARPGYTATLIHELEHARRDESSEAGVHTTALGPDGMDYDFDACAGKWAERAFSLGYLEDWQTQFGREIRNLYWLDDRQIERLKKLESIDKDRLLKELGFPKKK